MDEQENSQAGTPASKQSEPAPGTAQQIVPVDPLRELAAAWAKDPVQADPPGKAAGDPPAAKGKPPKSFNDLAGMVGLELDALYKLPVADAKTGKKYTVEELKAIAAKQDTIEVRSLQLDERVRRKEADFTRKELELEDLMAALPVDALKPEALKKVKDARIARVTAERQRMLEAIEPWGDENTRNTELKAMTEHLAEYGIPEAFLLRHFDANVMRFVRDAWMRAESIRKALELVEERKSPTPGKSKSQDSKPAKGASKGGPETSYDRAVSDFGNAIAKAAGGR